jgi:hypothetical protein
MSRCARLFCRSPIVAHTENNCARFGMANPVPQPPLGFDESESPLSDLGETPLNEYDYLPVRAA